CSPFIKTSPFCGKSKPFMSLAMVDFPDPLWPIMATHSLSYTSNERFFSTQGCSSRYRNDTSLNSINALLISLVLLISLNPRILLELFFDFFSYKKRAEVHLLRDLALPFMYV